MTTSVVHGKLGVGKSKFAVWKMRQAMDQNRLVATNLNLNMDKLMPAQSKYCAIRLPDKPKASDLAALPHGNPDSYDEDKNGVMVLDELGSWMNSRSFQDKDRAGVIDWLIHSRKHGWDLYLLVQNLVMIDKQVREALCEYSIKIIRADKIKIPLIGHLLPGKMGRLPRFHLANISLVDVPGMVTDREYFRGDDLHECYDTRQIFAENGDGMHSMLSAWHLRGRYAVPQRHGRPALPPKPKNELARLLARLPADRRIPFMREQGLLSA